MHSINLSYALRTVISESLLYTLKITKDSSNKIYTKHASVHGLILLSFTM